MPIALDATHDPHRSCWVQGADGHADFPIQNLPLGIFRPPGEAAQAGIAIGDQILSLRALQQTGLVRGDALAACKAADAETLNRLLALGARYRSALRSAVSALLTVGVTAHPELLYPAASCELLLPMSIGGYTDFYAGIVHAENVGRLYRPDNPLLANYKWIPIGYHGRSSSVRVSGQSVRRPCGQSRAASGEAPVFEPTRQLDFELELGIWIGPGNDPGIRIPIEQAEQTIAGYCLLNDWSARDLQTWEYQPLGPFLAKSFHTTISGWIITPEALAPFRQAQPPRAIHDPQPLPHLYSDGDQATGALKIGLEIWFSSAAMRSQNMAAIRLTRSNTEGLFWTPAQLVAHHASNGCNLAAGDLLGTGTISTATPDGYGSLLEMTGGGVQALTLPSGEERQFLLDGDEVTLRGRASRDGYASIGFGECRAVIDPAQA